MLLRNTVVRCTRLRLGLGELKLTALRSRSSLIHELRSFIRSLRSLNILRASRGRLLRKREQLRSNCECLLRKHSICCANAVICRANHVQLLCNCTPLHRFGATLAQGRALRTGLRTGAKRSFARTGPRDRPSAELKKGEMQTQQAFDGPIELIELNFNKNKEK